MNVQIPSLPFILHFVSQKWTNEVSFVLPKGVSTDLEIVEKNGKCFIVSVKKKM